MLIPRIILCFEDMVVTRLLCFWNFLTSIQDSYKIPFFELCSDNVCVKLCLIFWAIYFLRGTVSLLTSFKVNSLLEVSRLGIKFISSIFVVLKLRVSLLTLFECHENIS